MLTKNYSNKLIIIDCCMCLFVLFLSNASVELNKTRLPVEIYSKAVLLLRIILVIYVSCLSCFLVCSLQPCGNLLGKSWPLGTLVCYVLLCFVTFPCGVLGQVWYLIVSIIVSEYDQEIPQSQTADNPVAPRGRAAQPSRDTRKTK